MKARFKIVKKYCNLHRGGGMNARFKIVKKILQYNIYNTFKVSSEQFKIYNLLLTILHAFVPIAPQHNTLQLTTIWAMGTDEYLGESVATRRMDVN